MAGALVERDLPAGGTSGQYLKINASLLPEWAAGDTVAGHAASHQNGGTDEIATATPGANVIPKAGADNKLAAGFLPQATESAVGGAELATAAEIVTGTDTGADRTLTPGRLKTALASDGMWLTKRTKMPDVTGSGNPVYSQDYASGIDSLINGGNIASIVNNGDGTVRITAINPAAAMYLGRAGGWGSIAAKTFVVKAKAQVTATGLQLYDSVLGSYSYICPLGMNFSNIVLPVKAVINTIYIATTPGNAYIDIDAIWIGDYSYLTGTLSEEAARIADQLGDSAGVGVAASNTLTSDTTNVADAETVVIGGKTYTFKTSLTPTEGQVLIGADYQASLVNLARAINHTGTPDTDYKCAAEHPLVYATNTSAAVLTVTAGTYSGGAKTGELGNQITTTETSGHLAWTTATLSGGYSDAAAKMSNAVANASQGLTAKTSGVQADYELLLDSAAGFVKKKVLKSNLESTTQASGKRALYNAAAGLNANSISFPAVQVASADANTFDDYEEGEWTPTIIGSSTPGSQTYSKQIGTYTKIGRMVYLSAYVYITGKDAGIAGNVQISGAPFPFASRTLSSSHTAGSIGQYQGVTLSSGYTQLGLDIGSNVSVIDLIQSGSTKTAAALAVTAIAESTYFTITLSYATV